MSYICPKCGSSNMKTETCKGNGPHIASLICADCNRWVKWLSKREFEQLNKTPRTVAVDHEHLAEDRDETRQLYLKW